MFLIENFTKFYLHKNFLKFISLFLKTRNGLTLASGANKSPNKGKNFGKGHIILYSLAHVNAFLSILVVKEILDGFNAGSLLM